MRREALALLPSAEAGRVATAWSDRADMWFVEVEPSNPAAVAVSIGVEDGVLYFNHGGRDVELRDRSGSLPVSALRQELKRAYSGSGQGAAYGVGE